MPLLINGVNIFQLCEWGTPIPKHSIANSGLRLSGNTLTVANKAPVVHQSTYELYKNETYTPTGLKYKGQQVVLQKPGLRPYGKAFTPETNGTTGSRTVKITSNLDGEVYFGSRKIGKAFKDWNTSEDLPRGPQIFTIGLVSGGGGGGAAGLLASYNNNGGSGAGAVFMVRITLGLEYDVVLGKAGAGRGGAGADGDDGGNSFAFGVSITGGGGADGGWNNAPRSVAQVTDGLSSPNRMLQKSNGEDSTASRTISADIEIPDLSVKATSPAVYGGASGSGAGYGSGGNGNIGGATLYY